LEIFIVTVAFIVRNWSMILLQENKISIMLTVTVHIIHVLVGW